MFPSDPNVNELLALPPTLRFSTRNKRQTGPFSFLDRGFVSLYLHPFLRSLHARTPGGFSTEPLLSLFTGTFKRNRMTRGTGLVDLDTGTCPQPLLEKT